jgi:hypothetical protein
MSGLQHDIHYERYRECAALYNEKKWKESTEVARRNMAYCTMPRYLQVKTLLVLIGAEEHSWHKAEVGRQHYCTLPAERFKLTHISVLQGRGREDLQGDDATCG